MNFSSETGILLADLQEQVMWTPSGQSEHPNSEQTIMEQLQWRRLKSFSKFLMNTSRDFFGPFFPVVNFA